MTAATREQEAGAVAPPLPARVITARQAGVRSRVLENWRSRRLVPLFGRQYNEKRFTETWLGPLWLFLRPAFVIGSQLILFDAILNVSSGPFPYLVVFIVSFAGWVIFSETAYWSTRSLDLNRAILRRLYIPRGTLLLAGVGPALVDLAIILGFLAITLGGYALTTGELELGLSLVTPLYLAAGIALLLAWGLALGMLLAVPGAQARDVRFGLRYGLSFWYFLTPVAYPATSATDTVQTIVDLNPLTGPISLVKYGTLGLDAPSSLALTSSVGLLIPLLLIGGYIFFRAEAAALDHL